MKIKIRYIFDDDFEAQFEKSKKLNIILEA